MKSIKEVVNSTFEKIKCSEFSPANKPKRLKEYIEKLLKNDGTKRSFWLSESPILSATRVDYDSNLILLHACPQMDQDHFDAWLKDEHKEIGFTQPRKSVIIRIIFYNGLVEIALFHSRLGERAVPLDDFKVKSFTRRSLFTDCTPFIEEFELALNKAVEVTYAE